MKRVGALLGRVAAIAIIGLFAVSGMARIVSASLALPGETAEEAGPATASPPGLAAVEELELLLRDISRRDTELARREATLSLREQDMRVARDEIDRAILELEEAEAALEARMFASDTASEGDLTRLTAIYEGMKPKDAAALFGTMDPGFASGFPGPHVARGRGLRAVEHGSAPGLRHQRDHRGTQRRRGDGAARPHQPQ